MGRGRGRNSSRGRLSSRRTGGRGRGRGRGRARSRRAPRGRRTTSRGVGAGRQPITTRNMNKRVATDTITITGLRPSVTSDDVKEIFDKVGVVTRAFAQYNQNGRSTGTAEVKFSTGKEARDAVREFNGIMADERHISVTLGASAEDALMSGGRRGRGRGRGRGRRGRGRVRKSFG